MKILVTGGAGFIASQIADAYIAEGHKVFILDDLSTGFEKNVNTKAVFIKKDIIEFFIRILKLKFNPAKK